MTLQQDFSEFISERFDTHSDNERKSLQHERDNRNKQEAYLLNTLNDAQKELYSTLQELDTELQGKWEQQAYSLGFLDGVTLARSL